MSESPSEILAAKLGSLELTDGELLLLDHILRRAEAGDVREVEVEVEGFGTRPVSGAGVFDPGRLLRAGGITGPVQGIDCHTEPTIMCRPCLS